ncbi:type IV toxin-antitoxin system AbiEi family antitoxin domain-containing protein [Sphingobium olei]|uniref:Transcriptional regulator n=1 Tax=Sphingobium olei TaxID=420955 RepID=A0ABW3NW43_9SPHN
MSSLASEVTKAGLGGRIFDERQLARLLGGGSGRRYALVNRALKDGSLIRLKRGTYALGRPFRSDPIHPFAMAQAILPGSYISFETALSHHGWIPEAVFETASVTPGRKTIVHETPAIGRFTFHPLAIAEYQFLRAVERCELGRSTAFVASPLRALLDLVALRKEPWTGLRWVTEGLRIDEQHLGGLREKDFAALGAVYKHKAVNHFLRSLEEAVVQATARSTDEASQ